MITRDTSSGSEIGEAPVSGAQYGSADEGR